jgi:hypothetical protein
MRPSRMSRDRRRSVPTRRCAGEGGEKSEINPQPPLFAMSRCGAKTRAGTPCQSPPVQGRKRCRLHGGLSPGAPRGSRNGNYTNGDWTKEALEERRWVRSLVQAFAKTETGR